LYIPPEDDNTCNRMQNPKIKIGLAVEHFFSGS
jgi:hypothetical protein